MLKEYKKAIVVTVIITTVLVIGVVILNPAFKNAVKKEDKKVETNTNVNSNSWHAVFLSNGQVYFGKLNNTNSQYVTLTDVYYLRLDKPLQSNNPREAFKETDDQSNPREAFKETDDQSNPREAFKETDDQSKLSLIKLGKEVHGPTDQMILNRDHILFYEELTSDSKVVKSIEKYKSENK